MEGYSLDALPLPALAVDATGGMRASSAATDLVGGDLAALTGLRTADGRALGEWLGELAAHSPGGTPATTTAVVEGGAEPAVLEVAARADGAGSAVALLTDVTELHRRAAIIDAVADSVFVLDAAGHLTWQSDELQRRTGERDAMGNFALTRVHPEDLPRVMDLNAREQELPDARSEAVIRSRALDDDDRWQRIRVRNSPRRHDPLIQGTVVQVDNLDHGNRIEDLGGTDDDLFSLADALPLGVILADDAGRVVWANRRSVDLLPVLEASHLLDDEFLARFAPDDRRAYERQVRVALAGRADPPSTMGLADDRWVVVQGVPRTVEGRSIGVIVTLLEVTTEVEARQQVDRVTALLESSADIVVVFTADLELRYANDAALELLGEPTHRRLGEPLPDASRLFTPGSLHRVQDEVVAALASADIWRGELSLRLADGRTLPVSVLCLARRRGTDIESIGMVARDISDLKAAHDRLTHLASHDPLTGLPNRSQVFDRLRERMPVLPHSSPVAVLFCDLDGFKAVNDRFGHLVGDRVLADVADRLRQSVRPNDLVARVGGDEFAVVPEEASDISALEGLAQRLVDAIAPPFPVGDDEATLGVSVGVVLAEHPPDSIDLLLSVADRAMYEAKARGRGRWVLARWEGDETLADPGGRGD